MVEVHKTKWHKVYKQPIGPPYIGYLYRFVVNFHVQMLSIVFMKTSNNSVKMLLWCLWQIDNKKADSHVRGRQTSC